MTGHRLLQATVHDLQQLHGSQLVVSKQACEESRKYDGTKHRSIASKMGGTQLSG